MPSTCPLQGGVNNALVCMPRGPKLTIRCRVLRLMGRFETLGRTCLREIGKLIGTWGSNKRGLKSLFQERSMILRHPCLIFCLYVFSSSDATFGPEKDLRL